MSATKSSLIFLYLLFLFIHLLFIEVYLVLDWFFCYDLSEFVGYSNPLSGYCHIFVFTLLPFFLNPVLLSLQPSIMCHLLLRCHLQPHQVDPKISSELLM